MGEGCEMDTDIPYGGPFDVTTFLSAAEQQLVTPQAILAIVLLLVTVACLALIVADMTPEMK